MKRLLIAGAAALTLLGSNAAMARVDVGISIGLPGLIYSQPDYYYPPPPVYVERPRVVVVPAPRYYRPVRIYEPRYYHGHREYRGHGNKHWKKQHRRGGHHD